MAGKIRDSVMAEGKAKSSPGFKRGGHIKKKDGGKVDGGESEMNFAKRARGGRASSPWSSGGSFSSRSGKCDSGHEGE